MQRDKGEDRGGEEQRFLYPLSSLLFQLPLVPRFFTFSLIFSFIYISPLFGDLDIFTSVRASDRKFIGRRGRREFPELLLGPYRSSGGLNVTWFAIRSGRRGKGRRREEKRGEFRGGRFLSMLITVAGVNHDRPGARSVKWVRAAGLPRTDTGPLDKSCN